MFSHFCRPPPPPFAPHNECATALAIDNLAVRIGIHVGDIDRRGNDISGVGVHIAARAMTSADPGEIVVTASVSVSVTGQATIFERLGAHKLKGVPGTWELFRLANNQTVIE